MAKHRHPYVSAFDCDHIEQGPVNPKHRAHRAAYVTLNERVAPRATCSTGKGIISCDATFCPKHQPENYSEHMARHATDSIIPLSTCDGCGDPLDPEVRYYGDTGRICADCWF